jgi:hypothetical protein
MEWGQTDRSSMPAATFLRMGLSSLIQLWLLMSNSSGDRMPDRAGLRTVGDIQSLIQSKGNGQLGVEWSICVVDFHYCWESIE